MEKFIVKAKKSDEPRKFKPCQIYSETYEIVESVCEVSGQAKAAVIHAMIKYAYDNMIVEEE